MCTKNQCKYCVEIISLLPELKYTDEILFNLGTHCKNIDSNWKLMIKYYLMAIEKGNLDAMYNLGRYYDAIENNYDLMKKYYLMAIDKGDSWAMNNLGIYYKNIEKNYDLMKKYYLMANKYKYINTNKYITQIYYNYKSFNYKKL